MAGLIFTDSVSEALLEIFDSNSGTDMSKQISKQLVVADTFSDSLLVTLNVVDVHQNCDNIVLYVDEDSDIVASIDMKLIRNQLRNNYKHKLLLVEA